MKAIRELCEAYCPPLLVIDPLVSAIRGDEDSAVYMRKAFNTLRSIAHDYDLAVLVVHHPRKRGAINNPGQMVRGSSDIRNAVSSHLSLCGEKGKLTVKHDKCRYAPKQLDLSLVLESEAEAIRFTTVEAPVDVEKRSAVEISGDRVVGFLAECEEATTGELRDRLELAKSSLNKALKSLEQEGRIVSAGRGRWRLPGAGEC